MDIPGLIAHLQDLELPDRELRELIGVLTNEGLTDPVKRRVRAVLLRSLNRDVQDLERSELALEAVREHDQAVEQAVKRGEQALNRIDMRTKAALEALKRHVTEDVDAAKSGATLLLHTDDVAPSVSEPITAEKSAEPAASVELTPKQALATTIAAAEASPTVSPISAPMLPSSPSLPEIPTDQPLPPTVAPLPPTPIAPPIMPATMAASQPFSAPPAMTEPAAA